MLLLENKLPVFDYEKLKDSGGLLQECEKFNYALMALLLRMDAGLVFAPYVCKKGSMGHFWFSSGEQNQQDVELPAYTPAEFRAMLKAILGYQVKIKGNKRTNFLGAFCLPCNDVYAILDEHRFNGECLIDFVGTPTSLAIAILIRALIDYPLYTLGIAGMRSALKRAMRYDSAGGHFLDEIEIFALGKVYLALKNCQEFSPKFYSMLYQPLLDCSINLESAGGVRDHEGGFSYDVSDQARKVLELVKSRNGFVGC